MKKWIEIKDLCVKVSEKEILSWVTVSFEKWKNYVLLWKNGSWKSTLSSALAGNPKYEVTWGSVLIDGENLLAMKPEERSQAWLFLSFQNVPEIKGINLSEYLRTIYNISIQSKRPVLDKTGLKWGISPFLFKRVIKKYLEELKIDESFLSRDLNVGFSGGEKRKIEILQMKLIEPSYIILDEIDSGLDLDAFRTVATLLQSINSPDNTIIIITHYFTILDYIEADRVIVMKSGKIVKEGWKELVDEIKEKGFGE